MLVRRLHWSVALCNIHVEMYLTLRCHLCPIGTFHDQDFFGTSLSRCMDCPAGKYQIEQGANVINDCVKLPSPIVVPCDGLILPPVNAYCPDAGQVRQFFFVCVVQDKNTTLSRTPPRIS
jgi:hypothetical protein